MSKAIIVLKLKPKQFSKILNLAEGVYENLLGNPDFVNPQPTLAVLDSATDEMKEALEQWGGNGDRGSHADYIKLMAKTSRVHRILKQLAEWCMSSLDPDLSDGERAVLLSATGFALKDNGSPQGKLEAVQAFRRFFARNVREDEVKLRWVKPLNVPNSNNVKAYVIYRSAMPDFSLAKIVNVVSSTTFKDAPGSGTWYYWVTPVNSNGQGVMSEVVTARIAVGF